MQFFPQIRKTGLVFFCVAVRFFAPAQPHQFQFFPIKGLAPQQQGFVGKLGSHFFLLNEETPGRLGLYIYDTATQTGTNREYAFPKLPMSVLFFERSVLFISATPDKAGMAWHFLELNEEGKLLRKKEGILSGFKEPLRLLSSSDKKQVLFYQFMKKSGDSSFIRGSLIAADGEVKKQLAYSFKMDAELDAEPEIFLDNNGNTHILVFDKFTNYRISSDITVNSIPVAEEQIVSETFTFRKVKLKNLRVFQNNECNCMQVEGLYVDGTEKNNKGIYSIAFPFGRKNELAQRFIPFSDAMIKNFKHGFSATEEAIQNSIQLQDIIYSDSGSFAILRLTNGIPQRVSKFRPEDDPSYKSFNRNLSVSRGSDFQPPPVTTTTTNAGVTRTRTTPAPGSTDKYASVAPMLANMPTKSSPLSSRASGRNAPKLICVKLAKEQGFEWHASRSLDIFISDNEVHNRVFLIDGEKEEMPFVLYQADILDEPSPVLITMKGGRQVVEKFPEKKLIFSPIQFLGHAQYGSLYLNTETGEGGLMLIRSK